MKKFMSCVLGALMVLSVAAQAASFSSGSRGGSFSSGSRSSFSAPKVTAAPRAASSSSNAGLKSLGFAKPASQPTVTRPAAAVSSNSKPAAMTSSTSGGWFSKKTVSSAPAYKAPIRSVSSPVTVHRTVVVQRNYYGGSYGHNGYGYNSYYGPHYGYGGYGGGFGSSFAGTLGGLMMYSALTNNHSSHTVNASAVQIEQAKQDQRIEDKLDRVIDQQNQINGVMAQGAPVVAQTQVVAQAAPQCFLPEDAPLMMNTSFYCQPAK